VNDCRRRRLSTPMACLARSRGGLSAHRLPLTAYSIPAPTSPDAIRGVQSFTYIAGHILVHDCGRRRLSTPIPCLDRSRGGICAHRLPLTAYSIPALTSSDARRGVPITMLDGIGPFSGARSLSCGPIASESTVSLAIAIMGVSMSDLATSHNGEGLFLFGWSLRFR
jgi:hypothetical protein